MIKQKIMRTRKTGISRVLFLSFTKSEAIEISYAASLIYLNKQRTAIKNIPAKTQQKIAIILNSFASSFFKVLSASTDLYFLQLITPNTTNATIAPITIKKIIIMVQCSKRQQNKTHTIMLIMNIMINMGHASLISFTFSFIVFTDIFESTELVIQGFLGTHIRSANPQLSYTYKSSQLVISLFGMHSILSVSVFGHSFTHTIFLAQSLEKGLSK